MPKIIGIGGCSRSGKSSLARQINDALDNNRVLLLDMDDFVLPASEIPKINDRTDWERPESVDFRQLVQTIKDNEDYDVIVVEGILIFANQELVELMDTKIWMQISRKAFLERRKKETRWGEEPDWFLDHVWDSYIKYGQYPEADHTISGEEKISQELTDEILAIC